LFFFSKNKKIETKGGNLPLLKMPSVLLQNHRELNSFSSLHLNYFYLHVLVEFYDFVYIRNIAFFELNQNNFRKNNKF
jgi:hypothetical protein